MWTTPLVREPEDFYILFVFILVRLISSQMSKTAIKYGHNGSSLSAKSFLEVLPS